MIVRFRGQPDAKHDFYNFLFLAFSASFLDGESSNVFQVRDLLSKPRSLLGPPSVGHRGGGVFVQMWAYSTVRYGSAFAQLF